MFKKSKRKQYKTELTDVLKEYPNEDIYRAVVTRVDNNGLESQQPLTTPNRPKGYVINSVALYARKMEITSYESDSNKIRIHIEPVNVRDFYIDIIKGNFELWILMN